MTVITCLKNGRAGEILRNVPQTDILDAWLTAVILKIRHNVEAPDSEVVNTGFWHSRPA
jgi:hypothetical protein